MGEFQTKFVQIPKEENEQADHLAKAISAEYVLIPSKVLYFVQLLPLIEGIGVQEIDLGSNQTTPIVSYLKDSTLPNGKEAIRKLKVQVTRFVLIKNVLFKRGFSHPYLRCLGPEEAYYVMKEVHEGICGNHSGSRLLVHKLIQDGYYWLTMQRDAQAYVKTYDKCQRFGHIIRQPSEDLTPMMASWLFA